MAQVLDVVFVVAYTVIARLVDAVIGLRVGEAEEYMGLDLAQHGEEAYSWGE